MKAALLLTTIALALPVVARAQTASLAPCSSTDLYLATDQENGSFNGMSHGGTLVVVRNLGVNACLLSPIAQISFLDKADKDLGAKGVLPGARFMHPGPVVLPFALAANAEATATLRWVSSPVYDKHACITPSKIRVVFGNATLTSQADASICGDATKGITFDQTRFATDPVYHPPATKK